MSCLVLEIVLLGSFLRLGDEIGSGNFGVVYHGLWNHSGKEDEVAIKTSHIEASEEEKLKLLREAATVQLFLHTNIIKFYGVIMSRERVRNQQTFILYMATFYAKTIYLGNDCAGVSS